jgi:UDP-N-acetylmuramoyl-tripeptide--D-alanyl-D-alanine ligase
VSELFSAKEAAEWCGGRLLRGTGHEVFGGASIDTRTLAPGLLFVAIHGPNHDAHDYLDKALASGAAGLLIESGRAAGLPSETNVPIIGVPDTTLALGSLAAGHRSRFTGPVVGLTGSSGKTSTKEMCAAVLQEIGPCLKTEGNLNNEFGLPLTLLRREPEHVVAVVELGMNHRGEIAQLAAIARPSVALVTNIGTAHIEYLGSIEEIAAEKGDLFAALDSAGIAVANWDDPRVSEQSQRAAGDVLTYGVHPEARLRAENVRYLDDGHFELELILDGTAIEVAVEGLGETTIINALAASATGIACGLDLPQIRRGLARYRPVSGRMTRRQLDRDINLIDDTYNANPQSMRAALESLSRLCGEGRGVAVLGTMGELGENAERAHFDLGTWAHELGVARLVAVGESAKGIIEGALAAGMGSEQVHFVECHERAVELLRDELSPRDWVLVKGSRAARMERIVEMLCSGESN